MYNNVGLKTARGSGTNNYVQRNFASIKEGRGHALSWNEKKRREELATKKYSHPVPNQEILEHERKRMIEVELMEWADSTGLLDSNKSEEEIEELMNEKRREIVMMSERDQSKGGLGKVKSALSSNESTHCRLALKQERDSIFSHALGIRSDYREGDAFDDRNQWKRKQGSLMDGGIDDPLESERLKMEEQRILSRLAELKRLTKSPKRQVDDGDQGSRSTKFDHHQRESKCDSHRYHRSELPSRAPSNRHYRSESPSRAPPGHRYRSESPPWSPRNKCFKSSQSPIIHPSSNRESTILYNDMRHHHHHQTYYDRKDSRLYRSKSRSPARSRSRSNSWSSSPSS